LVASTNLVLFLFVLFILFAIPGSIFFFRFIRDPEFRAKIRNRPYRKAFIFYPGDVQRAIVTGTRDHFMIGRARFDIKEDALISGNVLLYDFDSPIPLTRNSKGFKKEFAMPEEYGDMVGGNALLQLVRSHFGDINRIALIILGIVMVLGFGILGYQINEISEFLANGGAPPSAPPLDGSIPGEPQV